MRTSPLRKRAFQALERRVARRVEVVGAVSEAEARLAREVVSAPRVSVVRNGIPELNPGKLHSTAVEQKHGVVAMGRIVPQRQPQEVASILAAVAGLAPVSWLGGAPAPSPELQALNHADIPVTGWLSREAALEHLAGARVYVHWTAWDGLPLSVLEAMARDVVVIASDIPANREILGPQQVFATEADAVEAVRRTLLDDSYHQRLLDEQRRRRASYGSTAMMRGWENVYRNLTDLPTAEGRE